MLECCRAVDDANEVEMSSAQSPPPASKGQMRNDTVATAHTLREVRAGEEGRGGVQAMTG